MHTVPREPATVADLLAGERQPTRYEFDGGRPVAMTGGTIAHNRIMRRLHRALERALAGEPCEPFGPDVKVLGRVRYPAAVVSCTPQVDAAQVVRAARRRLVGAYDR